MGKVEDATITSKFSQRTYTLKEINEKLEASNACLMLYADDQTGVLAAADILDVDGYPAQVIRLPGFEKPKIERIEQ